MPTVKQLDKKRPDFRESVWKGYEALYRGGHVIDASDMAQRFLPQHTAETRDWYAERLKRFHYKNIVGPVVDDYAGSVLQAPLECLRAKEAGERPELDEFYSAELLADPQGDGECDFNSLVLQALVWSMVKRECWGFIAYDQSMPGYQFSNRAAQEAAGALRTRIVLLQPERIRNCGYDKNGLAWVMLRDVDNGSDPLGDDPERQTYRWTYITRKAYRQFELTLKRNESLREDLDAKEVVAETAHRLSTFEGRGAVPLVRLHQPDALWILDKVGSLCAEELGKRNALSWYEYLCCFPQLKHSGGETLKREGDEADEAQNSKRGTQFVWELQDKDEALEWLEVNGGSLTHMAGRLDSLERDIYKSVAQMAAANAPSASAVMQSAASKTRDYVAKIILCGQYSRRVRSWAKRMLTLASFSRGDAIEWELAGADQFDAPDPETAVSAALKLQGLEGFQGSETWQKQVYKNAARATLATADSRTLDRVDDEIDELKFETPEERRSREMSEFGGGASHG